MNRNSTLSFLKTSAGIFIFCMAVNFLFAQTSQPKTSVHLLSDDGTTTTIKFNAGDMQQHTVQTPQGAAIVISIDKGTPMLKAGAPDLPKFATSIIVPDQKEMQVNVVSSNFTDYQNVLVAPSKGSITRNIDPSTVPYTYSAVYSENKFFPENIAELRNAYILRDFRGQTVIVYPFQYNPVTQVLRVYSDVTVSVSPSANSAVVNPFVRNHPFERVVNDFDQTYSSHFLNYDVNKGTRYTPLEEEGDMLIICYGSYMSAMQPFINWKIQKGMRTEMVDVATIGNTASAIGTYIANYYNTHDLAYVLLVGDATQVHSSSTGAGDSDNEYGYITGNDHYQEIFIGRFSAEQLSHVTTQVTKAIAYEKTPLVNSYYAQGVGIASEFGPGDDNQWDWEQEDAIRTVLVDYTYDEVNELFNGTWAAANDDNGDPSASELAALVNAGAGVINYTGHGSQTYIATTGFSNSDADNLTNTDKWPFVWIVGCVTGDFVSNTCFAEAWARATHNGMPTGSIANFMSTINQYWDEPMEAQDEANFLLTETYASNVKHTFGGLSINGCFSMNDQYGGSGEDMTDTWTIFGDPSVMVRTALPTNMTVSHNPTVVVGATSFNVNCNTQGALVSLTENGQILGTGYVNGGSANISFAALAAPDTMLVTVTAYNKLPYIANVLIIAPSGPYVVGNAFNIVDVSGNNNGVADYNENITLNTILQNVGNSTANGVNANLATTDPNITVTDASQSFGNILMNATATQNDAFAFSVANNVADQHVVPFVCTVTDNASNTWISNFNIILYAPQLNATTFVIDDASGNNNGYLDPGETATITITNANIGHSDALNAIGTLDDNSSYITVLSAPQNIGTIAFGATPSASFSVQVSASAPYGTQFQFLYHLGAGAYSTDKTYTSIISPAIETWESNTMTQFAWATSGSSDWFVTTESPFEGTYCAKSGNISDNQTSTLSISWTSTVGGSVSFEYKTSSEATYDFLKFYVDASMKDEWSGVIPWSAATYAITPGTHLLKWSYVKDAAVSDGGDCAWVDNILLPASSGTTGIDQPTVSNELSVYPNPFSQLTFISYSLNEQENVSIKIYNAIGQEVETLLSNDNEPAGNYQFGFDGTQLSNGIYFCHLTVGEKTFVKKIVLNK